MWWYLLFWFSTTCYIQNNAALGSSILFLLFLFLHLSICYFIKQLKKQAPCLAHSSYHFQVLRDQTYIQFLNLIFYFRLNFYTDIILNIPSTLKHPPSNLPLKLFYMKMRNKRMTKGHKRTLYLLTIVYRNFPTQFYVCVYVCVC